MCVIVSHLIHPGTISICGLLLTDQVAVNQFSQLTAHDPGKKIWIYEKSWKYMCMLAHPIIYSHSDGAVVRPMCCKPAGFGFRSSLYRFVLDVFALMLLGHMSQLWPAPKLNSAHTHWFSGLIINVESPIADLFTLMSM